MGVACSTNSSELIETQIAEAAAAAKALGVSDNETAFADPINLMAPAATDARSAAQKGSEHDGEDEDDELAVARYLEAHPPSGHARQVRACIACGATLAEGALEAELAPCGHRGVCVPCARRALRAGADAAREERRARARGASADDARAAVSAWLVASGCPFCRVPVAHAQPTYQA